jgi:hypothetical protein
MKSDWLKLVLKKKRACHNLIITGFVEFRIKDSRFKIQDIIFES